MAFGPCGLSLSTFAGGEDPVEAYEVMRVVDKSELGEELFKRPDSSGNVKQVTEVCHDLAERTVYRLETPVDGTASISKSFNSPDMGTYIFSAWSKSENVVRAIGVEYYSYSLVITINYTDGTFKDYSSLFSYGTHDWEYRELSFTAHKPVAAMSATIYLRAPASGVAYFDDISLRCANNDSGFKTFQDLPVEVLQKPTGQYTKKELKTDDGLVMGIGETEVTKLEIDGTSIMSDAFSGFLVRDIAATEKKGVYSFKPESGSKAEAFKGEQPTLGLGLTANYEAKSNHISVTGVITDSTNDAEGRSLQLSYALPVTASGWKWSTDVLNESDVSTGKLSDVYKTLGDGYMDVVDWDSASRSYYPHSALYNEDLGIAIVAALDYPQYWELEYDGSIESYVITFHLGVVKESPNAAKFKFAIYKLDDPDYGFRSAAKKYSQVYPQYYESYLQSGHGAWLAWSDVSHIPNVDDFGFKFLENSGDVRIHGFFEEEHGIDAYYYIENGDWWIPDLPETTADAVWERINDLASQELGDIVNDDNRPKYQALATQFCKGLDHNGEINFNPIDVAWAPNGQQVHINANPALPGAYNFYSLWVCEERMARLFDPMAAGGTIFDGYYIDEFSGWWLGNANFNREHYEYTSVPLTYSPYYNRPMLHRASTTWEFVKKLSDEMHKTGKTMFANKCPDKNAFNVPVIDAMGTEQTQISGVSYAPQTIAQLSTWRTLAYTKPFSILCNNDYTVMTTERMDWFFARCLPYAIFPSPCSNYEDGAFYWKSQHLFYERDRAVFQKYIPTLIAISEAGWEPVTRAHSDDSDLIIERYGDNDAEGYYFVIYNQTSRDKNVSVKIDLDKLNIDPECTFIETLTGEKVTLTGGKYEAKLPALSSVCIRIQDPNKVVVDEEDDDTSNDDDDDVNNSIPTYKPNGSGSNSGNTGSIGSVVGGVVNQITNIGGYITKIIKHHLTKQNKNFENKETYPWTPVLIALDALLTVSGVLLVLLYRRKKKA